MSAGPRDAAREKAERKKAEREKAEREKVEAATILALIPRAGWSNPALEAKITAFLSLLNGFPAEQFIRDFLRPAVVDFFCLAYYDGGRRRSMIDALGSLIRAINAERCALSRLHFAGIGGQFEAAPRSARRCALDQEEAVAQELLNCLRGTGHDATRPVRVFVRALADAWDACSGPPIKWDGYIDFDDPKSKDAHPFFEMVLMIFEQFRSAVATAGPEPTPTIFTGAPPLKAVAIPDQGSILKAFRLACVDRVPKSRTS